MKHMMVCPRCGSPDIEYASLSREATHTVEGLGTPEMYFCKKCKYEGPIIVEMTERSHKKFEQWRLHKRFPHERKTLREGTEILKPIFSVMLLLFAILGALMLVPKQPLINDIPASVMAQLPENMKQGLAEGTIQVMRTQGGYTFYASNPQVGQDIPAIYISFSDSNTVTRVSQSTGIDQVGGFLFPVFLLFFVIGLMFALFYSHWHRVKLFS